MLFLLYFHYFYFKRAWWTMILIVINLMHASEGIPKLMDLVCVNLGDNVPYLALAPPGLGTPFLELSAKFYFTHSFLIT